MIIEDFIKNYDKPNTVVLLEGKRIVTNADKESIKRIGGILSAKTKHIIFRSGNADGADNYFSKGFLSDEMRHRFETVVPYLGHRRSSNPFRTINIEDIALTAESELVVQSKTHKQLKKLIDLYVSGEKNKLSYKAAYILRDTLKVLGSPENGIEPASFALFYDDLADPRKGGTGHTMNICEMNRVPYLTQETWMKWV